MNYYDYIIVGGGASGLMSAYRMSKDVFFDDKTILILDKVKKNSNDRTWCYWETENDEWNDIASASWKNIIFKSELYKTKESIAPYRYKMIRSKDFYSKIFTHLKTKPNITFQLANVLDIQQRADTAEVITTDTIFKTKTVLNSILFNDAYKNQTIYPVLQQHFVGFFIRTKKNYFDESAATFMDFTVDQKTNTRFMYVLPVSANKALFEYTLFSKDVLTTKEYERELQKYLELKSITDYTIIEKEKGVIPMTSFKFWQDNSKNILNIGTVGGWTKASTGYTFKNTSKKTIQLIAFLKTDNDFTNFRKKTRFWFYDLLMLDVLANYNHLGSKLFSKLFQRNSLKNVFRFLDEETSFIEDLRIMLSMPPLRFIIALFRRVLKLKN